MGGTPNGLKQFLLQGRTTIKENVFQNCLRSYPLWEGMMDFHAWVGSKITHGCFYMNVNGSVLACDTYISISNFCCAHIVFNTFATPSFITFST